MRSGAEIKVGIVVVAALVTLGLVAYFLIGGMVGRAGYPLDVVFERAEVRPGDTVVMSGVTVGHVESVELTSDNKARVALRLNRGVTVRKGYSFHIVAGALFGEQSVEIRPVPARKAGRILAAGSTVKGAPYVRMQDLITQAHGLLGQLSQATQGVTALMQDKRMRDAIQQSVTNLGKAAADMSDLARELRGMAVESRPRMRTMLANMDAVTRDLRVTSDELSKGIAEAELPETLQEASRRVRSVLEKVDDIATRFDEMANDPEMGDMLQAAARNLRDTTESIRQAGEQIRSAAANANSTVESLKEASKDAPAIADNVRETSQNLRDASVNIKEMSGEARSKLGEVTGSAAKAAEVIKELPKITTGVSAGTQYLTHEGRWWIDANLDFKTKDRLLRIGVADLGETNRFNLEAGQPLGRGRLRYGLIESEVGAGYDWPLTPWLTLSAEAFDPNDLRANVFGYWGMRERLPGWSAVVGYRGVGGGGSPVVGVRVEK
jgi:ABC-type transporter Mla subunit MlaD